MSFLKRRGAAILIESAAIFLSVVLAFAVEQWRDDRNEQARAASALALVKVELQNNLVALEALAPTRQALLDDYMEVMDGFVETGVFPRELPQLIKPEITTIAYELATDTGAVATVPPDDLINIARAYEALEAVKQNDTFLNSRNAQIRFRDGEQYLSGFMYYANRAMANEPDAIAQIRDALEAL